MTREGDWIQTYTGKRFFILDPRAEDFDIRDVAHALAMKCRYNGHCDKFYSVAQHCVHVADECEKRYPNRPSMARWGLMHDLAEAYLPDIPRPIKHMGVGILAKAETLIMACAATVFQLYPSVEPKEVKAVDSAMLATEAHQLMKEPPNDCQWFLPEPPVKLNIDPWYPWNAEEIFLSRYEQLFWGYDA